MAYGDPLWESLVKTIAEECEVEETTAESAATAVLAMPRIKKVRAYYDAMGGKAA